MNAAHRWAPRTAAQLRESKEMTQLVKPQALMLDGHSAWARRLQIVTLADQPYGGNQDIMGE
jgi:hypothetical protein